MQVVNIQKEKAQHSLLVTSCIVLNPVKCCHSTLPFCNYGIFQTGLQAVFLLASRKGSTIKQFDCRICRELCKSPP